MEIRRLTQKNEGGKKKNVFQKNEMLKIKEIEVKHAPYKLEISVC
jgi:hypothetical protein